MESGALLLGMALFLSFILVAHGLSSWPSRASLQLRRAGSSLYVVASHVAEREALGRAGCSSCGSLALKHRPSGCGAQMQLL